MTLRIAHVVSTPRGVGGAERVLAALVDAGRQQRWHQTVLNPFAEKGTPALADLCRPVEVHAYPARRWIEVPATRAWVRDRLRDFSPEIVHAHLFHAEALVASLPRINQEVRVLTHHHGALFRDQRRPIYERIDRAAGRRMDAVVAVSSSVRRYLIDVQGYDPRRVITILNGWEGTPRMPEDDPGPTIICVSNFRPEKAHHALIGAFHRVVQSVPDARLVLVGSGSLEQRVRDQVEALNLGSRVEMVGHVSDVWPHLARARVFALSSTNEPLGIAALEALASGLPAVVTDVGGLPEIVRHRREGLVVPPGDELAMAEALLELLTSPRTLGEMSVAARQRADELRMDRMIDQYRSLYLRLTGGE